MLQVCSLGIPSSPTDQSLELPAQSISALLVCIAPQHCLQHLRACIPLHLHSQSAAQLLKRLLCAGGGSGVIGQPVREVVLDRWTCHTEVRGAK